MIQGPVEDNFKKIFRMNRTDQLKLVEAAMRAAETHENENPAFSWLLKIGADYPEDVCVLAPIFLNFIRLNPGQSMYIKCGEVHSYLQGVAVELMSNSDNVVRGGLTKKHVDIEDFLGIATFSSGLPVILIAEKKGMGEFLYPPLCEEFQLSVITVQGGSKYTGQGNRSVEIIMCMEGEARIKDLESESLKLDKGDSVIIPAAVNGYTISGDSIVYKASVPHKKSY
jgi:mannose-6-phosphate isomerase